MTPEQLHELLTKLLQAVEDRRLRPTKRSAFGIGESFQVVIGKDESSIFIEVDKRTDDYYRITLSNVDGDIVDELTFALHTPDFKLVETLFTRMRERAMSAESVIDSLLGQLDNL